jgi:hypothetical protein
MGVIKSCEMHSSSGRRERFTAVRTALTQREEQGASDLVEKMQMISDAITSGEFVGWK